MPRPKVLCFINYKGGVGKTTSTYHIGCSLAGHHEKNVLLIDIDPQTNLTFLCATIENWERQKRAVGTIATMYKRYLEGKPLDTKRYIWRSPVKVGSRYRIEGLDLIPCDIDLIGEDLGGGTFTGTMPSLEALRKNSKKFLRERSFIRAILRDVDSEYDYVLIDCPPNLYLMTQNALAASHYYIITAIPDHLSTIGLSILTKKVDRIGDLLLSAQTIAGESGPRGDIAILGGVIFVMVRIGGAMVTNVHYNKMVEIKELLGAEACFAQNTTELIGYSEAAENCVPVWALDSQNARRAAEKQEYQDITKELLRRF